VPTLSEQEFIELLEPPQISGAGDSDT
jgi:hypothetical protein